MFLRSRALSAAVLILVTFLSLAASIDASAKGRGNGPRAGASRDSSFSEFSNGSQQSAQNDSDLVRAVNDRRNVNFVEAANVTVVEILPDDTQGLPHQKWVVQLSSGAKVNAVYNSDMGARIPVKIGAKMALGGEFKMTNIGPLIHWLHYDPRGQRPDGYVEMNGVRYGGK